MQIIKACILSVMAPWSIYRRDYRSAILQYETLWKIYKKRYGNNHIKTVPIRFRLAYAYHHSGNADNFRYAMYMYEILLFIAESSSDRRRDKCIAEIAESMGDWYADQAEWQIAESFYRKAIKTIWRYDGKGSSRLSWPYKARLTCLLMGGLGTRLED